MTWDHERAIRPLVAASEVFCGSNPGVEMTWDARPLQSFESQPLRELASTYDLMVIDHPHLGEAAAEGLLVDFAALGRDDDVEVLARQSVGPSHASYTLYGGQWALAVDAAAPVASYRPDRLSDLPADWDHVVRLARSGEVVMPLRPPHGFMAFCWIARNCGFALAESSELLLEPDAGAQVLEQLRHLAGHLDPACLAMDPIAVYELMSTGDHAACYCPHGYGYIPYALDGFRPYRLKFANVPDAGGGGVAGTALGGTGMAVSELSAHKTLAIDFAFMVTGAACQAGLYAENSGQPANAAAWESDTCNEACHGFFRDTRKTLQASWVRPRHNGYLAFQHQASVEVSAYLTAETGRSACVSKLQALYRDSFR